VALHTSGELELGPNVLTQVTLSTVPRGLNASPRSTRCEPTEATQVRPKHNQSNVLSPGQGQHGGQHNHSAWLAGVAHAHCAVAATMLSKALSVRRGNARCCSAPNITLCKCCTLVSPHGGYYRRGSHRRLQVQCIEQAGPQQHKHRHAGHGALLEQLLPRPPPGTPYSTRWAARQWRRRQRQSPGCP